jgi:hypothetical protein
MSKVLYMAKEIMDPNHERWDEFVNEMLKMVEFCDTTHRTTRSILQKMQGIDVDATLEFFESQGGYCDCEVILNVMCDGSPLQLIRGRQGDKQQALYAKAYHWEALEKQRWPWSW